MPTGLGYDPYRRAFSAVSNPEERRAMVKKFEHFVQYTAEELILCAREVPHFEPQIELEDRVAAYLESMERAGEAASSIARRASIIRAFFARNFIIIQTPAKYRLTSVYESKRVLKQHEVRKMIGVTPELERKAVICFLSQTGQRVGILTGLRYYMINQFPQQKEERVYGIATVPHGIKNSKGEPAGNKGKHDYQFGIHWESMSLLKQMYEEHNDRDRFIWDYSMRWMQGVVSDAAERARVQNTSNRTLKSQGDNRKWKWSEVHAHVFRRYWVAQMIKAKVSNPYILEYQMGHRIPQSITYYWGLVTENNILQATRQAAKFLEVLSKHA